MGEIPIAASLLFATDGKRVRSKGSRTVSGNGGGGKGHKRKLLSPIEAFQTISGGFGKRYNHSGDNVTLSFSKLFERPRYLKRNRLGKFDPPLCLATN